MIRIGSVGMAALLLCAGCRTPVPASVPLAVTDPRPAALLARHARVAEDVQAIRGAARVSIEGQRGASFARQLVLLERPARLRVEVIGLLDQRIAVLATDGDRYQLYRAETGAVEDGLVYPQVLQAVAGLPLSPEEAVALLLGAPGLTAGAAAAHADLDADGTLRIQLVRPGDRFQRQVEFDSEGQLRRYRVADANGAPQVDVHYDDFQRLGEVPFAHTVRLDFPAADVRAEVRFRRIELNPVLDPRVFRLPAPGAS